MDLNGRTMACKPNDVCQKLPEGIRLENHVIFQIQFLVVLC